MKKLLSMALAMMLAFASMGVVATGEEVETDPNLVFYTGFEVEALAATGGIIANKGSECGITADEHYLGEKCAWVAMNSTAGDYRMVLNKQPVESGETYKLSFWYKFVGQYEEFAPTLYVGTSNNNGSTYEWKLASTKNNGGTVVPKSTAGQWNYYEVYVPVPEYAADISPVMTVLFRATQSGRNTDIQYYDEIRLEKVDGVSLSFADKNATATSDLTSDKFGQSSGDVFAAGTEMTVGNTKRTVYPFVVKKAASNTATGSVRVFSHYVPQDTAETTTLIAGVYKDVNGTPQLQNVFVKPCVYNETIEACIDYLDVDMTSYEGCYIEAFMLDGANMLKPMGDSEVLPAVTPAV